MMALSGIFFKGLVISFLGTIPLGNINMAALQLAAKENVKRALLFAFGAVIVEMLYLIITLHLLDFIISSPLVLRSIKYVSVAFMLLLSVLSFVAAFKSKHEPKYNIVGNHMNRFWLGVMVSGLNPVQIPFWAGWAAYLLSVKWLTATNGVYNVFTLGAGAGTIIALMLFIYAGKLLSAFIDRHTRQFYFGMGLLFAGMALYQGYLLL